MPLLNRILRGLPVDAKLLRERTHVFFDSHPHPDAYFNVVSGVAISAAIQTLPDRPLTLEYGISEAGLGEPTPGRATPQGHAVLFRGNAGHLDGQPRRWVPLDAPTTGRGLDFHRRPRPGHTSVRLRHHERAEVGPSVRRGSGEVRPLGREASGAVRRIWTRHADHRRVPPTRDRPAWPHRAALPNCVHRRPNAADSRT